MNGFSLPIMLVFAVSMGIQFYLRKTYGTWSKVANSRGMTGAEVARKMLDENGLGHVAVNMVAGELSDHYNPMNKTVNLSEGNYGVASVAAMAVAAHEVGHAIQDKVHMPALVMRGRMAAPLSLSSNIAPFIVMGGIFFKMSGLIWLGVFLLGFAMLFHLITLPVEFDASRRALVYINERGLSGTGESQAGAQKVLSVAALTYIAGFALALLQFMQLLGIARNSRD